MQRRERRESVCIMRWWQFITGKRELDRMHWLLRHLTKPFLLDQWSKRWYYSLSLHPLPPIPNLYCDVCCSWWSGFSILQFKFHSLSEYWGLNSCSTADEEWTTNARGWKRFNDWGRPRRKMTERRRREGGGCRLRSVCSIRELNRERVEGWEGMRECSMDSQTGKITSCCITWSAIVEQTLVDDETGRDTLCEQSTSAMWWCTKRKCASSQNTGGGGIRTINRSTIIVCGVTRSKGARSKRVFGSYRKRNTENKTVTQTT